MSEHDLVIVGTPSDHVLVSLKLTS